MRKLQLFIDKKVWEGYFTAKFHKEPQPSDEELKEAFTWGYIASLYVHSILDCSVLFEKDITNAQNMVCEAVYPADGAEYYWPGSAIIYAGLYNETNRYLLGKHDINVPATCWDAFIAGYKTALVIHKVLDRCLIVDDHASECIILVDLLSFDDRFDQKCENATHASARIILKKYGKSLTEKAKEEYRKMIKDGELVDNGSKVIAEIHTDEDAEDQNNP